MQGDPTVTVLGAGIAGLALAAALARAGVPVRVLEQAPAIGEVGAGIQISPNGARVLESLGLGERLGAIGQPASAVALLRGESGRRVTRLDLARGYPVGAFRYFHRADLIAALADAARDAGATLCLGRRVTAVTLADGGAPPRVTTDDGDTPATGLLIGADGINSRVRAALEGTVAPYFTGQVAWRATIPASEDIPAEAQVYMGRGRHLVTYPLRGGSLRNLVAVEERAEWAGESWSATDDPAALRRAFAEFAPEVRGWLELVERPNLWGLFRHPVARRWHGGGAAILGDAAHPTLPFLAQGANMALEDARVLADCLTRLPPAEALPRYQSLRRTRSERIVAAASANARNYHLSGLRRDLAHAGLGLIGLLAPGLLLGRLGWLYGYDATKAV